MPEPAERSAAFMCIGKGVASGICLYWEGCCLWNLSVLGRVLPLEFVCIGGVMPLAFVCIGEGDATGICVYWRG